MFFSRLHFISGMVAVAAMTSYSTASTAPSPVLIEAEQMTLLGSSRRYYATFASGSGYIAQYRSRGSNSGSVSARAAFSGETGHYDIVVGYFDETDGQSNVDLIIDGVAVDSWIYDADRTGTYPGPANATVRSVAAGYAINAGSVVEISAIANQGELATIDYIRFVPSVEGVPTYDEKGCLDNGIEFSKGSGCWVYHDDGANADKPVRVWYYYPPNYSSGTKKVLFAMHGSSRQADEALERWQSDADMYGALLIAPEFTKEHYSKERNYGRGNVRDERGDIRDKRDWTFMTIEEIFDLVRREVPDAPNVYSIQGHSGGAQFVHRMALTLPEARIETAVAAGAGWYLLPDDFEDYPCGISDVELLDDEIKKSYATDLVFTLGTEDIDSDSAGLSHNECAEAQGSNRYERGHFFYQYAQGDAWQRGHTFNWDVVDVPGVGHEADGMVEAGADAIFGGPPPPEDIVLTPTQDATVKANYPRTNYGKRTELQVDGDSLKTTYMQFDLNAVKTLSSAVLRLKVTDGSRATQRIWEVASNDWDEDTLTYNNRPAATAKITSIDGGSRDSWVSIDITGYVAAHKGQVISIALESTDGNGLYFKSKEAGTDVPQLVVYD